MTDVRVVVDDSKRAQYIMLGLAIVGVLTYLWFFGVMTLVSEQVLPKPKSEKLMSAWSIGTDMLGDALYFLGVLGATVFSGIGSLIMNGVKMLVGKTAGPSGDPGYVTKADLEVRTTEILEVVQTPLNEIVDDIKSLSERINGFSAKPAVARKPRTVTK